MIAPDSYACPLFYFIWGVRASRVESANFVVARRRKERVCSLLLSTAARRFPTLTPFIWGVRASRGEAAYFVVARRRISLSARFSSARRRAIPDAHAPEGE
jgi:hypothetical protein